MSEEARRAFVERLRARRIELGLRQRDIGWCLGVDNATVGKWELHRRCPPIEAAQRWAEVLGVQVVGGSLGDLFASRRAQCGTPRGYKQHRERGERCPQCWAAWSVYNTAAYWRRKGAEV